MASSTHGAAVRDRRPADGPGQADRAPGRWAAWTARHGDRRAARLHWARTTAFAAALTLVLAAARGGRPPPVIVLAFVIYTVVATVWVRGQYAESGRDSPWLLPPSWVLGLGLAGLATGGAYLLVRDAGSTKGTLAVAGLVLAYLTAGSLLARLRVRLRRRPLWGAGLVCAGAIAGVALAAALGDAGTVWVLVLAAVTAFSLPPGVALLSEVAIERLADPGAGRRRGVAMAGGLLVFAGVAVMAVPAAGTPWILVPLAALGLLVVALASSTQADIVVVLAGVAFMGTTPGQVSGPQDASGGRDVLVALGDSYMSGEGAGRFFAGTDEGGGNTCRRAPSAWAAMAGQEPLFDGIDFLACSGASTYNVRDTGEPPPAPHRVEQEDLTPFLDTQLAQYRRKAGAYRTGLVVISIGGNDSGFSTIGQMCLAPGDCSEEADVWLAGLDEVTRELQRTYRRVRDTFPGVPVVVVPYPSPIAAADASGTATPCSQVWLEEDERSFITRFINALNGRIRAAADEARFHYLADMRNALRDAGLQLCDPRNDGRPGVNFIGLRSVNGTAEQRFNPANWTHGSLHPNERGHAAMLRTFQVWLAQNPDPAVDAPDDPDAPPIAEAARPVPGTARCSVYDTGSDGCRAIGTRWALDRVGGLIAPEGLVAGLAAAGAWAAAVGFFGWRRYRRSLPPDDAPDQGPAAPVVAADRPLDSTATGSTSASSTAAST